MLGIDDLDRRIGDEVTACVWVGYTDTTTPMTTLYNGGPVMGGTFPALIWHDIVTAYSTIIGSDEKNGESDSSAVAPTAPVAPATPAPTEAPAVPISPANWHGATPR